MSSNLQVLNDSADSPFSGAEFENISSSASAQYDEERDDTQPLLPEPSHGTLKAWLKGLTRKDSPHRRPERYVIGWPEDEATDPSYHMFCAPPHGTRGETDADADRASVTSSSILRTVKTASFSGRSISLLSRSRSRPNTLLSAPRSGAHSSDDPSASDTRLSRLSMTSSGANRLSVRTSLSLDEGAFNRAMHRRQIIKELFETEMTYVSGLKTLADVISTFIVTRTTLHRSTLELVHIHEKLLGQLRDAQPSDGHLASFPSSNWTAKARHSAGARFSRPDRKSLTPRNHLDPMEARVKSARTVAADPAEAARVVQILQSVLPSFEIYEDYMVTYQLILKEVEAMRKSTVNWQVYDLGIEALIKSVAPHNRRENYSHQSFTLGDLLMKPVQRVCKYRLFLADLLKCTPVTDCPTSHFTIDLALQSISESGQNINRATADPYVKDRIQKTLLLREMIVSPRNQHSGDVLREFGYLKVCGVLHVAYRTEDAAMGEYMLCCLFNTHLLLANVAAEGRFAIVASIPLSTLRLEAADNSNGLVCERPSFSWKIVFDHHEGDMFEFLMTACSDREAWEWKQHTLQHLTVEALQCEHDRRGDPTKTSRLNLNLKPLDTTLIDNNAPRRTSVPMSNSQTTPRGSEDVVRVLIKGTRAVPQDPHGNEFSIGRSLSMQHSHRPLVILTPRRVDRIRMEKWLSNVWTTDILPYPGMPTWRGERSIRSSATQLIRKISSNRLFSRRQSAASSRSIDDRESVASWRRSGDMDSWHGRTTPLSTMENGIRRSRPGSPMSDERSQADSAAPTMSTTLPFGCPRETDEHLHVCPHENAAAGKSEEEIYQLQSTLSEQAKGHSYSHSHSYSQRRQRNQGRPSLKSRWSSTFLKAISHPKQDPGGFTIRCEGLNG